MELTKTVSSCEYGMQVRHLGLSRLLGNRLSGVSTLPQSLRYLIGLSLKVSRENELNLTVGRNSVAKNKIWFNHLFGCAASCSRTEQANILQTVAYQQEHRRNIYTFDHESPGEGGISRVIVVLGSERVHVVFKREQVKLVQTSF